MKKEEIVKCYGQECIEAMDKLVACFSILKFNEDQVYNQIKNIDSFSREGLKEVAALDKNNELANIIDSANQRINQDIMDDFEDSIKANKTKEFLSDLAIADKVMLKNHYEPMTFENDSNLELQYEYHDIIDESIDEDVFELVKDKNMQS